MVGKLLPGWFPHLPDQSQYNRRLRRLVPQIAAVQLRIAELIAAGELRIADGTLIGGRQLRRLRVPQRVRGHGRLRLLRGQEPVRVGDAPRLGHRPAGVPVGYTLVAADEKEYEPCVSSQRPSRHAR